ncbi:MAG: YtxH domain-containing protein [Nitrospirae bacterium]|nr:YtxH domain-containing protein [Nitrospirota bacterium]MCL5421065.1 YtxH domain-containing protein [Nitrospirota bacterium]
MRHDEEGYGASSIFLSFLLGGLMGAGVALLLAPKSGRETRQRIRELADDVKVKAEDYVEQAKGKVSTAVEKGKGFVQDQKSIITSAVEAGKEAYEKEKERLAKEQ